MARLDMSIIKGETAYIGLVLSDNGVPLDLTDYTIHFAVTEEIGMPPVIDIDTSQVGQTTIVVVPLSGQIDITLAYTVTKLEFTKGSYSILLESSLGTVTCLLYGDWDVIPVAEVLP